MKKLKALIAVLVIMCSTSLFAKDFDWSESWCNYGAGIEQGDKLLSIDAGLVSNSWSHIGNGYWFVPAVIADFQIAQPIWKLPFTFGGYVGFDVHGYNSSYYDYTCFSLYSGGIAAYHVMLPPENLDVYVATKLGFQINIAGKDYPYVPFMVEFHEVIGASWYFNDGFGINLELGYPVNKFGVIFKF